MRQPSGGRRRFSISSGSRARGFVWPVWPVHRKNAKRVMTCPRNAAAMPAGRDRQPAAEKADPEGQEEQVAIAPGRPEPRRQRVQDRLGQVGEGRVDPGEQQQAEEHATERRLVDERGGDGVEQGTRVRPRIGEPDPVVAEGREADRDEDADQAVGDPAEDRAEPVARAEEQVALGRRMDEQDRDGDGEAQAVPGQPPPDPGLLAVRGWLRSTRPSRTAPRQAGA